MTSKLKLISKIYGRLLCLYPTSFRREFEVQMLLDFTDMAMDAKAKGRIHFFFFCLRELVDFPVNLLRVHLQEGWISKVLRSQPVNYGMRGALGYGVVFGLAILINQFIIVKLFLTDHSIIGNLQVLYFDLFHTEHGLELISWIPDAVASLLTGFVLGILFAVLFGDRSKYSRYIMAGMLGWFLHDAIISILGSAADIPFFLGTKHTTYLSRTELALSGAFLGLTFVVAKSEKKKPMCWLAVGTLAYPLISYFYMQVLFKLSILETPWMFVALMVLMIIYISSVFIITLSSGLGWKAISIMIWGTITYQLVPYVGHIFAPWVSLLIPFPVLPASGVPSGSAAAWQLFLRIALDNSIYGIVFGLIMGSIFGLQKKNNPPQVTV